MNILITGTSSGIGYGLAQEFLKNGDKVWGMSRRDNSKLSGFENYHHLNIDLTDFGIVEKLAPAFLNKAGYFDLVVLNAGILGEIKFMEETSVDEMKRVFEVNVWANKVLLDILFSLKVKIKHVVGISSGAALRSTPGWGAYSMSKAGLDRLMNIYANEYPNIHFSALAPGLVDTKMQDYICAIKETEKYPSAKTLQQARYTELMPDPVTAAPVLVKAMGKTRQYESGSHVDVREM